MAELTARDLQEIGDGLRWIAEVNDSKASMIFLLSEYRKNFGEQVALSYLVFAEEAKYPHPLTAGHEQVKLFDSVLCIDHVIGHRIS